MSHFSQRRSLPTKLTMFCLENETHTLTDYLLQLLKFAEALTRHNIFTLTATWNHLHRLRPLAVASYEHEQEQK